MPLTAKQEAFICEYLVDKNATQAAIRAGYSEKTARSVGQENLTKPDIKQAIAEKLGSMNRERILSAEEILAELTKLGTADDVSPGARIRALELLGKYEQLFLDRVKVSGDEDEPIRVEFGIPRPARLQQSDN